MPTHTPTGLTLKIALYGDDDDAAQRAPKPKDALPKLRITDDVGTVRAVFDELEREALKEAKKRSVERSNSTQK